MNVRGFTRYPCQDLCAGTERIQLSLKEVTYLARFNTVYIQVNCISCGEAIKLGIQFRYGEVLQHNYRLNDRLSWGYNNVGQSHLGTVLADGTPCRCPAFGLRATATDLYLIRITDDVIVDVAPNKESVVFPQDEDFVNIEQSRD